MTNHRQRITNALGLLFIALWLAIIVGGISGGGLGVLEVGVWSLLTIIGVVGWSAWGPGVDCQ